MLQLKCVRCGDSQPHVPGRAPKCKCGSRGPWRVIHDVSRDHMTRYDALLQMAEKLWQKERAQRAPVEGAGR